MTTAPAAKKKRIPLRVRLFNDRYIYLLLLPGILWYAVFQYGPMYGVLMAFKNYKFNLGVLGSPWVGFTHFQRLFASPEFSRAFSNTLTISLTRMLLEFPAPILLAILLSEMRYDRMRKIYQTVFTLPHFLSWVVLGQLFSSLLGETGSINQIITSLGGNTVHFLTDAGIFRPMLYATSIWRNIGWSAIIFTAAIANIDPSLYEAAVIDGASRLRRIWHITLPCLRETVVVMLILQSGKMMNAGFEQIFNLYNPAVRAVSDILDTYVYRITFEGAPNYSFSTAVGLFKSVINLVLLVLTDHIAKRISGTGLFGGERA